jgi:MFS family permease
VLWRQPVLLLGLGARVLAAASMTTMMTAAPVAGLAMGMTTQTTTLATQLHMVGMFAPGLLVARWIGRIGERRVAVLGAAMLLVAGWAGWMGSPTWAFLLAMFAVGVGWNLASSGGAAMIVGSYTPPERGRVQPVTEFVVTAFQVTGSLSAGVLATISGWGRIGATVVMLSLVTGTVLGGRGLSGRRAGR